MFRIFYRFQTALARLILRSGGSKDLEIIVLRHKVQILRVTDYINHYNTHRPHRSLDQQPPLGTKAPPRIDQRHLRPAKSIRCHGLINEHRNAA